MIAVLQVTATALFGSNRAGPTKTPLVLCVWLRDIGTQKPLIKFSVHALTSPPASRSVDKTSRELL